MSLRPLAVSLLILAFASAGCRDREIAVYRAPKDPPRTLPPGTRGTDANASGAETDKAVPDMAGTSVPTADGHLSWTAPSHWTAMPERPMRKASFAIKGAEGEADLSITAFPGETGGLLANVNRWRGQIALPPLAESDLAAQLEKLDAGALHFQLVDMSGNAGGKPTRILGGILAHHGETWFFKLMGPDALVAREKPAFVEFLRTVREHGNKVGAVVPNRPGFQGKIAETQGG